MTLIEPGSCFAGTLAELPFASDRSYMLVWQLRDGDNKPPATIALGDVNFGAYPMANGLTRLQSRFLANPADLDAAKAERGEMLDAERAQKLGLVTFAPDDIDWDDEVRVFLEERASFSPDALTGLEANLRFAGPETMESKIFARLTAWQTGFSSAPTPSARTARSSVTAPARSRCSIRKGCEFAVTCNTQIVIIHEGGMIEYSSHLR